MFDSVGNYSGRRYLLLVAALWIATAAGTAQSQTTIDWINPSGGAYDDKRNWDGNVVPGAADTAQFRLPDKYEVTFPNTTTSVDDLIVADGLVTFAPTGAIGTAVYSIADEARIAVGELLLTNNTQALNVQVGDFLEVNNRGTLSVTEGSDLDADTLWAASGGTINVTDSGSTLDVTGAGAGQMIVGVSGAGTLNITNGGVMSSDFGSIGPNTGSSGEVTVRGAGSTWTNTGFLSVGGATGIQNGNGLLTISGGGLVTSNGGELARGGLGTVTVTGAGSRWTNSGNMVVGLSGGGTLNIMAGGMVSNTVGVVGDESGGSGIVFVSDPGSTWTNSAELFVGDDGQGVMTIQRGGSVSNTNAIIGQGSAVDSIGTVIVREGASWTNSSTLHVASAGQGTLRIESGGRVSNTEGKIGAQVGSVGMVTVTGTDGSGNPSRWTNILGLFVGESGAGTLEITAGGVVSQRFAVIGLSSGASGAVSVSGAGSRWDSTLGLTVSGTLTIADGGVVSDANAQIGLSNFGNATVTGAGSTWTTGGVLAIGGTPFVPAAGGVLTIDSGGTVNVGGNTKIWADGTINLSGGTLNTGSLEFAGSTFNFTLGTLNISGTQPIDSAFLAKVLGPAQTVSIGKHLLMGGVVTLSQPLTLDGGTLGVGNLVGSPFLDFQRGTLNLTGTGGLTIGSGGALGSDLTLGANKTVNVTGATTINADSTLILESGGSFSSFSVDNSGEVVLDGASATINALLVNNSGLLRGRGRVGALLNNLAGGEVRVATGELLQFINPFIDPASSINIGRVNLLGGTVEFTSLLTNAASGQIIGHGSLIAAGGIHNDGTIAFSGPASVLGDVTNDDGVIISSGGGPTTFFDDVVNDNEIRTSPGGFTVIFGSLSGAGSFTSTGTVNIEGDLSPGNSPAAVSFEGDLSFGAESALEIEIGGLAAGSQFDRVEVAGALHLDGTLDVSLINGFAPSAGNSFDILDWDSISGTFDSLLLPALDGGLAWNTSQLYTTGVLAVIAPGLPGDYNADGSVDAADYVVWRKTDGSQPGYDLWRTNFGRTAGSGATFGLTSSASIPEPDAQVMLLAASLVALYRRQPAAGSR